MFTEVEADMSAPPRSHFVSTCLANVLECRRSIFGFDFEGPGKLAGMVASLL